MVLAKVVNQETKGKVDSWNKIMKSVEGDLLVEEEDLKEIEEEEQEGATCIFPP